MRSDIDPDVFLSEVFQLRDEISDLGEAISNECLTTIIKNVPPEEMYSIIRVQSIRNPDLGLEQITSMIKTIFINHSERSSVPKRIQQPYRKNRDNNGREPTMNGREAAMTTVITRHNCKNCGIKQKTANR